MGQPDSIYVEVAILLLNSENHQKLSNKRTNNEVVRSVQVVPRYKGQSRIMFLSGPKSL